MATSTPAADAGPRVAMYRTKRGMKLQPSFDEDEWTLAWDALRKANLAPGTAVAAQGFERTLPAWFWSGLNLTHAADAATQVRLVPTTLGSSVAVHAATSTPDVETEAKRIFDAAPARKEDAWQLHRSARDLPDGEGDYPLGAYVTQARHDEVTALRMRLAEGKVVTWTQIGAGAAPTEFARWQQAYGAYYTVLVECGGQRTVGVWGGESSPSIGQAVQPALRRLFRTQGNWRHGVVFVPV